MRHHAFEKSDIAHRRDCNTGARTHLKEKGVLVCSRCGDALHNGRWTWGEIDHGAEVHLTLCPACRREKAGEPAGTISIGGGFYQEHRGEIAGRVRNIETMEKGRHPLERIIAVDESDTEMRLSTSGVHVARRIGEGLVRAFKGDLAVAYSPGEEKVSVQWER